MLIIAARPGRAVDARQLALGDGYFSAGERERLVAVQRGHTDGGKLVRELYGHADHGALAEIDRYLDTPTNVVPLRLTG